MPETPDNTHSAILISTLIGLACLAAAPLIGALCAALAERVVGLAYSLGEGKLVVRIAGAVLSGLLISLVINGVVFAVFAGRFAHGRLYLVTLAIALMVYGAILVVRLVIYGDLAAAFLVSELRDPYVKLATGLYLVYGPAVAAGYAPVFWLFHLWFRQAPPL